MVTTDTTPKGSHRVIVMPTRKQLLSPTTAEQPGLLPVMDVLSLHLYGAVSLCTSIEEREVMRRHLNAMLAELDEVSHAS